MDTVFALTFFGLYLILFGITVKILKKLSAKEDGSAEAAARTAVAELKQDLLATVTAMNAANAEGVEKLGNALSANQKSAAEAQVAQITQLQQSINAQTEALRKTVTELLAQMQQGLGGQFEQFRKSTMDQLTAMMNTVQQLQKTNEQKLGEIRETVAGGMKELQEENGKKLDEIKGTVDEKLQSTLEKRISESFKTVSEQLNKVYAGLGEMQNLASDVGGLKKVLSGVKTRGILGEIRLGAILEEILPPEQYETNVATVPGSAERVEFAIRLPGAENGTVYLPVDSKFPGERYQQLVDALESGDKAAIELAYKELEKVLDSEAKDIHTKYISVPYTTGFAIMFLPFEGLYAEVVNRGLIEKFQQKYQVNVAGPSTMAAYLNSLQMGFRTLAIQKRSNEVWQVLGAVKSEFDKFDVLLKKMQGHLTQTAKDLDELAGVRSRAIVRKLKDVQIIDSGEDSLPELPGETDA